MSKHDEAPGATGACLCVECNLTCRCNYTIDSPKIKPPRMGTALRSDLMRYSEDLIPLVNSGDKFASGMLDCCNNLLIESDRLEGGDYGC